MKRSIWFLALALIVPFFNQCRPQNILPISKECTYNGAHSGTTVKMICTGIGHNHASAFIDAKKAAMWHIASPLLQTPEQRSRFSFLAKEYYKRHNTFFNKARADDRILQDDEGRVRVRTYLQVNRAAVVKYFKDNGFKTPAATRKKVGNPTIAITTTWKTVLPNWRSFVRNSANEFLTSRKYNAIDLTSGMKKLNALQNKVLKLDGIPVDKKFRAAMMMGADIYIEIAGWNDAKGAHIKAAASIKAYETTTGRLLGSSTGFGERYPKDNQNGYRTIKEAIQNTVNKVLNHVNGYWTSDAQHGNRYYLALAGKLDSVPDMTDLLALRIKKMKGVTNFKRPIATKKRMVIHFHSKMDQLEMSLALKRVIRGASGVKKMDLPVTTRKFFLFVINPPSSSDDKLPDGI